MICGILDVFLFYFLISVPRLDLHVVNRACFFGREEE